MKVLFVNKFYREVGGAERVMLSEMDWLARAGHETIPFSMRHAGNITTRYDEYFVDETDYHKEGLGIRETISTGVRSIYSRQAALNIGRLLDDVGGVDVAQIHNINYQITPAILPVLRRHEVPVVWTLHDPQLVCPHHRLYDYRTNEICEDCAGGAFFRAVKRRCIQGSWMKSAVGAAEAYLYRWLKTYERYVDVFVAPSKWLRDKVIAMGSPIDARKIVHVPNAVDVNAYRAGGTDGGHLIFVGRLSHEKGLDVLREAIRLVRDVNVVIVGEGPAASGIKGMLSEEGLKDRVVLKGFLSGNDLRTLLASARALIAPSTWNENCPMSILEAYASGVPVIASDTGGVAELVHPGRTGWLVPAGDVEALGAAMREASADPTLAREMGDNARTLAETAYAEPVRMQRLVRIYQSLAEGHPR